MKEDKVSHVRSLTARRPPRYECHHEQHICGLRAHMRITTPYLFISKSFDSKNHFNVIKLELGGIIACNRCTK